MSGRNFGYLKVNRRGKEKIVILSVLLISFLLAPFLNNFNIYNNSNENNQKNEELPIEYFKTQSIASDNTFSGIGSAWNVSHWANRTDYDLSVGFGNGTSDTKYMNMGVGWEGYQLNGTIKELYDKRNWVNGTFEAGDDDNDPSSGDDDSYKLVNWTFKNIDIDPTYTNAMSGNYFDSASAPSGVNSNCMELRMDGDTGNSYDKFDKCWWETIFTLPRGIVSEGEISLDMYPWTQYNPQGGGTGEYGTHWSIQVIINGVLIDDKNLIWIEITGNNGWAPLKLQLTNWLDNPTVFPTGAKNMNLTIQLIRNGASLGYADYGSYQQVLIDNVTLSVKSQVNATQIGLQMNEQPVSDIGTVEQISAWTTTPVEVKFNSTEVRPPEMGGYDLEFKTDLNLFARKENEDSHYQPNFIGTSFKVTNDSSVEWESYARVSVPTGYKETNMTIEFPEDVNITWISNAEEPNTNILKYCNNLTTGLLKVYNFSETPDGFWWIKGESPNYCSELNIYNNATGSWVLNNTFLSGDSINITGKIESAGLDISGYIENTKARLYIRFPSGTIWTAKNQIKPVNDTGMVYFDPILIPSDVPNYEVGEYEAIITWNNSYSSFELNETGVIYKTFIVTHNSSLIPDQYYYANIFEGNVINLKVSFNDFKNGKAIEDADVYVMNFTGGTEYFAETSPGFYLLEFNTTGGVNGTNNLTIYANHTLYENKKVNVTIDIIFTYTELTAEEYPIIKVAWNKDFTIHLNYTVKTTGNGINDSIVTIDWVGDKFIESANGIYNITCNSSAYEVNQVHKLKIELNKEGYESQTMIISIELTEREAYIDEIFINGVDCTTDKSYNIYLGDPMNITVKYKDNEVNGAFIPNATVTLNGTNIAESFTENKVYDFYNLILDSTKLGVGFSFLNIISQKENFTATTELLTINVFERSSYYKLYLNGVDKTLNPVFNLTIGETLNITVKYTEQTGEYIPNAVVQLIGEGILINLTKDDSLQQHSRELDTANLKIGVNLFSIVAKATNYEIQTESPIITINRISTLINISSQINVEPGDDVTLEVILMDMYFGDTIKDAVVTYRWAYGQGELLDLNNTGTYEGFLENVPEGTYTITINAFKSDNYDFITKEITLIVTRTETETGPDLSWLVYVLIGAIIGLVGIFTLYQKTLKYPPTVRKSRKIRKKIRKGKKTKPVKDIASREDLIKAHLESNVETIQLEKKTENGLKEK